MTPAEKYPVLYLCHGGNGDEGDWISGKPDVILGNLIAKDEAKPMIMVLVNCRARMNDGANPSDSLSQAHMDAWTNFLFELQADIMPYMEENYPILTGRENTGICGLSMGGRESLYIGFKIPEKLHISERSVLHLVYLNMKTGDSMKTVILPKMNSLYLKNTWIQQHA